MRYFATKHPLSRSVIELASRVLGDAGLPAWSEIRIYQNDAGEWVFAEELRNA